MHHTIRSLVRTILSSELYGRVHIYIDASVSAVVRWGGIGQGVRSVDLVLIAPPGAGNIGDQALVEAALDNSSGHVVLVVRTRDAIRVPPRFAERVELLVLPRLLYGDPIRRLSDLWRLCRLTNCARQFWVIGADIMDGAYNPIASVARFSCARSASQLGCEAKVLGFSWNDRSTASARIAARISGRSVKLFARDPNSLERLNSVGVDATLSADIVFARAFQPAQTEALATWMQDQRHHGKKVVVVNASGLLVDTVDQAVEITDFLSRVDPTAWSCVTLPHVIRIGNDDLTALAPIRSPEGMSIFAVDQLLSPDEIMDVVLQADLVVTGRMHLAVLSTLAKTFSITLASQGKVEGLYSLLGRPDLCVTPQRGFGRVVTARMESLANAGLLDQGLAAADLAQLTTLATRNFQ